jgi:hypothetical protein
MSAEAWMAGPGFVLAHPARVAAAEAEAPAMSVRRVKAGMVVTESRENWQAKDFVKDKSEPRYGRNVTLTNFLLLCCLRALARLGASERISRTGLAPNVNKARMRFLRHF